MIPSLRLVRRTVEAETAYTLSRLEVLQRIPGNPVGIAIRRIDEGAVAVMARHLPVPDFNSVIGLHAGLEHLIEPLLAWYGDAGVTPRFETVPAYDSPGLGRELVRLGYYQAGFNASLISTAKSLVREAGRVAVEHVDSASLMEDFLEAYCAGRNVRDRDGFKANVRPWLQEPGWRLYLARAEGRPAAAAILYRRGSAAYCADATTDPRFRGRGLHAALLERRIADAWEAGADFVCGCAQFMSQSQRNMMRAGLRVQFVRALWCPL